VNRNSAGGNRVSQHTFAQIPDVHIARSKFDRSHTIKDTFDFDYLVPCMVEEIYPGDTMNLQTNTFGRLATQKVPIMDNLYVDFFYFFVPNRLVMDNWEKLQGAQDNPGDSTDYIAPQMTFPAGGPEVGTIFDKYGMPTDIAAGYTIKNTLALRAYMLIWNEWFRDQNMQNSVAVPKDDGPDVPADFYLLKRGKRHDYFTSALPFPQKGPAVTMPLGTSAPIVGENTLVTANNASNVLGNVQGFTQNAFQISPSATKPDFTGSLAPGPASLPFYYTAAAQQTNPSFLAPHLTADLSAATAPTINALRQAFAMQSIFELDARGGTRYVEALASRWNVTSPDFRLQRPEFLGGGKSTINSHIVAQTSPTSGGNAQGQLAAFGTQQSSGSIGFSKSFVEHGWVIGLMCARADITYQQGLDKKFNRSTRFDYMEPKLLELGEQAVLNKEIYTQGTSADELVFGYQEAYAELRYAPSRISGEFRSTYAQTLDYWHMAEEFGSLPALNSTFIQQNTPIERAIAVADAPHLIMDIRHQLMHSRAMPVYSIPAHLGRF
jgi:hypothetical protein